MFIQPKVLNLPRRFDVPPQTHRPTPSPAGAARLHGGAAAWVIFLYVFHSAGSGGGEEFAGAATGLGVENFSDVFHDGEVCLSE